MFVSSIFDTMKNRFLFPNKYKVIGWLVTFPSLLLAIATSSSFSFKFLDAFWIDNFFSWSDMNFTDEVALLGLIIGLIFLAFSKEKIEDEQIARVRLDSLQWSVYLNYLVLIILILGVHGIAFLSVTVYNMFTLLIFFLIRFNYVLHKQRLKGEK